MKVIRVGLLWLVSVLLAVVMVGPGIQKFTSPAWERMFRAWGYPEGFYLVIGAIEVAGGLALLVPRLAGYAGAVLAIVMVGAGLTQVFAGGRSGVGEFVFATLLAIVAYVRRPAFARLRASRYGEPAAGKPASLAGA